MDYRRGTFLSVAAEETGAVQGVQGVDGGWIDGRAHEYTTWSRGRVEMELEKISTGEEPHTYRMVLLPKGGLRSCPVEGCPGQAATRESMGVHFLHRNCGHFGGGKPPTPNVPPMQHYGPLTCF